MSIRHPAASEIAAAEQHRQAYLRAETRSYIGHGVSVALMVGAIALGILGYIPVSVAWIAGLCGLLVGITSVINHQHSASLAQNKIKRQLVEPILRSFGHEVEYDPERSVNTGAFRALSWFNSNLEQLGQDFLRGTHGNTKFVSSMMHGVQNHGQEEAPPSLLLVADSNKHFKGRTVVVTKLWQGELGRWASDQVQRLKFSGLQPVQLEDITFEQLFDVYAHDQVQARYLLTPDVMQRLVSLRRTINRNFRIAYDNGRVYVQVEGIGGLDLSLKHKIYPNYVTRNIRYRWELIGKIIDALGLNDRVWTKP